MALSPIASRQAEAASIAPNAIVQSAPDSLLPAREWRDRRHRRRFWFFSRHDRDYGHRYGRRHYDRRYEGYRDYDRRGRHDYRRRDYDYR